MASRFVVLLYLTALLAVSSSGLYAQNLLTDSGFEAIPAGTNYGDGICYVSTWRYFSVNGAGGSLSAVTPGYEGNRAVKLTRASAVGDSGIDRNPDLVPVLPGHRYRAVLWAKSDGNSKLLITLAAHDSVRNFLGTQKQISFQAGPAYRRFVMEYVAPATTAYLNFAVRVDGPGDITVDSCELTDLSIITPQTPTVTYPVNETVDSFRPTIAFQGAAHTAYQCIVTSGETTIWDSGAVTSTAFTCRPPSNLSAGVAYQAKVRVQNSVGWSDYSPAPTFTTPVLPIVKFTSPTEADVVRGPTVRVNWQAEAATGITAQSISIDGGSPITLTTSRRYRYLYSLTEGVHTVTLWVTSAQGTTTAGMKFYVRRTPTPSGTVYYYDMSYISSYSRSNPTEAKLIHDVAMAVSALQGLVNRGGPRLFVKFRSEDSTWWSRMTESDNWLSNKSVVTIPTGVDNLAVLFDTFAGYYDGAVVWDPNVNATCNVACTVAGADNLVPIRYDLTAGSVYDRLVVNGTHIPVQLDLTNRFTGAGTIWDTAIPSTGSTKNDAYVWARTKYLESGKSNPSLLFYGLDGYWIPNATLEGYPLFMVVTRDYVVQNKGFCFDLSVWGDEAPVDDPTQSIGLDLSTLRSILEAAATRSQGMVEVVGCVPWHFKYTNHHPGQGSHDPVATEWESIRWFTYYNAYLDSDSPGYSDFGNLSLYSQFPLPDRLTQNRRLSCTELRKLGYVSKGNTVSPVNFLNFYMGDYDSSAWLGIAARSKWDDANRGSVPISWPFNPNLIKRAAGLYDYFSRTRTDNDTFIAGDSGSGYVNPTWLLTDRLSGLPSARDIWIEHNLKYFRQANVKLSGFLINGYAGPIGPEVDSMFEAFSGDGVFSSTGWYPQGAHMSGTMPALPMQGYLAGTSSTDAGTIRAMGLQDTTNFLNYRVVLTGPTYVVNTYGSITSDTSISWALVDAYTYTALAKCAMGVVPDYRATYTFDTIPDTTGSGYQTWVSIGVRNDGWVTWDAHGDQAAALLIKWMKDGRVAKTQTVPIPRDLASAEGQVLEFSLASPTAPGSYTLAYEICRGGTSFSAMGDYAWESTVTVTAPSLQVSVAQAKAYLDGTVVSIPNVRVSAGTDQFADAFYVQDAERTAGVKVCVQGVPDVAVSEGDIVTVIGRLSKDPTLERVLADPAVVSKSPGMPVEPLGMPGRSVGGGMGWPGVSGLLNTGLLIRTWGRVGDIDTALRRFCVDDGSRTGGLIVDCGDSVSLPEDGSYIAVTGISSRTILGEAVAPMLRLRKQSDLLAVSAPTP